MRTKVLWTSLKSGQKFFFARENEFGGDKECAFVGPKEIPPAPWKYLPSVFLFRDATGKIYGCCGHGSVSSPESYDTKIYVYIS